MWWGESLMGSTRAEKGEKDGGAALATAPELLLPQTGTTSATELADEAFYAGLQRPPVWYRRWHFAFERFRAAFVDNWRADCDLRNALFLWFSFAVASGAAGYYALPDEPNLWAVLLAFAVTGSSTLHLAGKGRAVALGLICSGLLFGLAVANLHGRFATTPMIKADRTLTIAGRLERKDYRLSTSAPEPGGAGRGSAVAQERWVVQVHEISGLARNNWPVRLLFTRRGVDHRFAIGQGVRIKARIGPIRSPVIPGGFDYRRYLWARSIGGQGYIGNTNVEAFDLNGSGSRGVFATGMAWVRGASEELRDRIARGLYARLEQPAAGLAIALAVGKRDYLSDDVRQALRTSGLAHILAISGLHMALVAFSVFFLTRLCLSFVQALALNWPIKRMAALVAFACASFYLLLSGGSVSALRAYIMTGIVLLAMVVGRPALTMHNLALALILVVMVEPYGVVEPGLQMSFAATAALVAVYGRLRGRQFRRRLPEHERHALPDGRGAAMSVRLWSRLLGSRLLVGGRRALFWLAGMGVTSLIAGLAVLPFSIAHFQQMAPLGLVANLGAMPFFSLLVMPAGLLVALASLFGLQALPLTVMAWGVEQVIDVARWVSDHTSEHFLVMSGHTLWPLFFAIAIAIFSIHRGRLVWLALVPLGLALAVKAAEDKPDLWLSASGRQMAYRDEGGHWQLAGAGRSTFAFAALLKADGEARGVRPDVAAKEGKGADPAPQCDRDACGFDRLKLGGSASSQDHETERAEKRNGSTLSLALVLHPSAFAEECAMRDIILTPLPVPQGCNARILTVGRGALEQGGAHYIWLDAKVSKDPAASAGPHPAHDPTVQASNAGRSVKAQSIKPEPATQSGVQRYSPGKELNWNITLKTASRPGRRPWE